MNAVSKFRSFRRRRNERQVNRAAQQQAMGNLHQDAHREMMIFTNRMM